MTHSPKASILEYADTKDLLRDPARVSAHWVDEDRQCGLRVDFLAACILVSMVYSGGRLFLVLVD